MACSFSLPVNGNPETLLAKARQAVQGQGGTFDGDAQAGSFRIAVFGNAIAGTYVVSGTSMNIIISEKPFLLPCSTIEGFLKAQLGV